MSGCRHLAAAPGRHWSPSTRPARAMCDKTVGVNEETFQEALVAVSIAEPVMDEAGTTQFIDSVADADFMRIYYTAFALNRTSGGDPKAGLASRLTHKSDEN